MSARAVLSLVIGILMIVIAVWIALTPLVTGRTTPITTSRLLDLMFAAFFLLRGGMNVRNALRPPRRPRPVQPDYERPEA